jgi:glyoxylase-like metal-dependent hydrolase (beta-lactamase superfamily II)
MMWIREPQRVSEGIEYLGTTDMCIYLLKGREYMFIEGGMSYVVPTLLRQLDERAIDQSKITKFLILHSHFDHCGIVPFFKKRLPQMEVLASARTKEVYGKEKAIHFIRERNRAMIDYYGMEREAAELNLDFETIAVDRVVKEGERVDLGDGVIAECIEVPGHSSCSIAAYVGKMKALFASDAAGIPNERGAIYPMGNENFIQFRQSLAKLNQYDVEILCAARNGVFLEKDGREFISRTMRAAEQLRQEVIDRFAETGSRERVTTELCDRIYAEVKPVDIPKGIFLQVIKSIVENIVDDDTLQQGGEKII